MKTRFVSLRLPLIFLFAIFFFNTQGRAKDRVYTRFFSSNAAAGYDVVAYFTEQRPVKGLKRFREQYLGVNWYFSSEENLDRFGENPERYAPQYGGFCAWAVAQGYTAKGDPLFWSIVDGKLYLNYDEAVQHRWLQNTDAYIKQADRNWPGVIE